MTRSLRRNPIIRAVAVLALALGFFAVAPGAVGAADGDDPCTFDSDAADAYAASMHLSADPTTVRPGETTVITGTGYPGECDVEVFVDGASIGWATTDTDGTFRIDWVVPADQAAGPVVISTNVNSIEVTTDVTVVTEDGTGPGTTIAPTDTTPGTGTQSGGGGTGILPKTGSQILPFLGVGVALLVLGSVLVLANRKRSATH